MMLMMMMMMLVWFGDCVMDVFIVLYHVRVKAPPSKVGC